MLLMMAATMGMAYLLPKMTEGLGICKSSKESKN